MCVFIYMCVCIWQPLIYKFEILLCKPARLLTSIHSGKFFCHIFGSTWFFNTFILFCLTAMHCLEDRTLTVTVDCSYQTLWALLFLRDFSR